MEMNRSASRSLATDRPLSGGGGTSVSDGHVPSAVSAAMRTYNGTDTSRDDLILSDDDDDDDGDGGLTAQATAAEPGDDSRRPEDVPLETVESHPAESPPQPRYSPCSRSSTPLSTPVSSLGSNSRLRSRSPSQSSLSSASSNECRTIRPVNPHRAPSRSSTSSASSSEHHNAHLANPLRKIRGPSQHYSKSAPPLRSYDRSSRSGSGSASEPGGGPKGGRITKSRGKPYKSRISSEARKILQYIHRQWEILAIRDKWTDPDTGRSKVLIWWVGTWLPKKYVFKTSSGTRYFTSPEWTIRSISEERTNPKSGEIEVLIEWPDSWEWEILVHDVEVE